MCCDWQRHYFEVSNINHDESIKCETVKGTLNFHSVHNVGIPGIIEVCTSHVYSRNHSDDSISDDSDYEDNIPSQIVQEGLNAMSGESPICGRTRIKNC